MVRCVLSMAAFCDQLRRMNPELEITRTANNRTTRYLNFFSTAANPGPAPEYLNPVSYTHLDVYKRQSSYWPTVTSCRQ